MKTLNFRLPDDVYFILKEMATLENRSLNAQVIQTIKENKELKEEVDRLRRIIEDNKVQNQRIVS